MEITKKGAQSEGVSEKDGRIYIAEQDAVVAVVVEHENDDDDQHVLDNTGCVCVYSNCC